MEDKSGRDQAAASQAVSWAILQGPGRGYIALESDLPLIADALETLWFLRGQRRQADMLRGAKGGVRTGLSR